MATRSNIAYRTPEGKIRSVYCHWDGYPAHNGEMLRRYYKDFDKVKALVDLGQISALKETVHPTRPGHSFDTPHEEVTIFYGRDRGETNVGFKEFDDVNEWINDMEEYAYLYDGNGQWLVNDHGERDKMDFPVFDFVETKIDPETLAIIGWEPEEE